MRPVPYGTRGARTRGILAARRSAAFVRMVFLVGFTGFLLALIIATVFAAIIIAINGRLP
jgi:hypothetical protein